MTRYTCYESQTEWATREQMRCYLTDTFRQLWMWHMNKHPSLFHRTENSMQKRAFCTWFFVIARSLHPVLWDIYVVAHTGCKTFLGNGDVEPAHVSPKVFPPIVLAGQLDPGSYIDGMTWDESPKQEICMWQYYIYCYTNRFVPKFVWFINRLLHPEKQINRRGKPRFLSSNILP